MSTPIRTLTSSRLFPPLSRLISRAYSSGPPKRLLQTATMASTIHPPPPPTPIPAVSPSPPSPARSANATATITTATTTTTLLSPPSPPLAERPSLPRQQEQQQQQQQQQQPRKLRARKSAITLTAPAMRQLRKLLSSPTPKFIRVGVRNRGCSGLSYHLEYVDRPGKFDEEVVQDGVKVLIDSRALFSIIGSEMDWEEDKLSAKFVFRNPNIKDQCGCGESFSVG